jgi:hypothetical protein
MIFGDLVLFGDMVVFGDLVVGTEGILAFFDFKVLTDFGDLVLFFGDFLV